MTKYHDQALLAARILLSLLFIVAGIGKLGNVEGFAGYMASGGVPAFMAWPVILMEIIGGIALLVGFRTRIVALVLGAFCIASGVLYHFEPSVSSQMTSLLKNFGLAGGYLALAVAGSGRFAVKPS